MLQMLTIVPLVKVSGYHSPAFSSLLPLLFVENTHKLCLAKIITGSFQGFLRIFQPHKRDFSPEDLLLEQQLGAPVLQVAVGRFLP